MQGQPHFHIPLVVLLVQAGKEIPSNPPAHPPRLVGALLPEAGGELGAGSCGGAGTGTPLSPHSLRMVLAPTPQKFPFWSHLPAPSSLCLLGLLGSLLAELNEGLSFFVLFPGFQQLQDLICQRRGE